jgi:hypothetical protein
MSDAISQQHPAVVLRSHYNHLRTLLAIAMLAVVGLTVAVVVLATNDAQPAARLSTVTAPSAEAVAAAKRLDGGPEEGTHQQRGRAQFDTLTVGTTRYDGGPEEGTRGPGH